MPSHQFITPPEKIVSKLSFSHIREIMTEKDPLGRFFYETECIKGCWSVKELCGRIPVLSRVIRMPIPNPNYRKEVAYCINSILYSF